MKEKNKDLSPYLERLRHLHGLTKEQVQQLKDIKRVPASK